MQLKLTFTVLASMLVAGAVGSTASDITTYITTITTDATALYDDLLAFPTTGGTKQSALTINTKAQTLGVSISKGVVAVQSASKPLSESDAESTVKALDNLHPVIVNALTTAVSKKASFSSLSGVTATFKQDLNDLYQNTTALESALISAVPTDQVLAIETFTSAVNTALNAALTAYN